MAASAGNIGDVLRRTARLQISVLIRKPNDRVEIADIDPLRIRSLRIKRNAERFVEAGSEDLALLRLAFGGDATEDVNLAFVGLGHEEVAVRCCADKPGIHESGRVELNLESLGSHRPDTFRPRNQLRGVAGRLRCKRAGRSATVILRVRPGFSNLKSVNGGGRWWTFKLCGNGRRLGLTGGLGRRRGRSAESLQVAHNLPALLVS